MPNYQYQCQSCGKQFMKSLPFGSKNAIPCPLCKGVTKRLITPPAVHFKGAGFYKTDSSVKPAAEKSVPAAPVPAPPTVTPAPSTAQKGN